MLCSFADDPDMTILLRLAIFEFEGHDQYNLYNADALLTLGSIYCASHSERLENLAKAKKAFEEAGFKRKIPHVLFHMAVVRLDTYNPEMALPLTKKAYSMFRENGDKYMTGAALALHGVGLHNLGRDRESLSASKKALIMLAEFDDKEMIENLNELIKELEDLEDLG
jgi:tetratricopeptide (TPR) repeat protein